MKINEIETVELLEYEKRMPTELVINERRDEELDRYYVSFENCDMEGDGVLIGAIGNGDTMDQALKNYCERIELETIIFFALDKTKRTSYQVPRLIHTKLLNK